MATLNSDPVQVKPFPLSFFVSVAFHCALLIAFTKTQQLYRSLPAPARSLQVSLKTMEAPKQEQIVKPKPAKRKISKPKKAIKKKQKVAASEKTNAPVKQQQTRQKKRSFDFYIKNYTKPNYPRLALRRGLTGKVLLKISIGANGEVIRVAVSKSSGHAILDNSALKAAKNWSFKPLVGKTASLTLEKRIAFDIVM